MKTRFNVGLTLMLGLLSASAQIVPDGGNVLLITGTNFFPGDVIIGTNNPFTLLTISTDALLTNSGNGIIGLNSTAKSNEVRLISATARWLMGTNAVVGN